MPASDFPWLQRGGHVYMGLHPAPLCVVLLNHHHHITLWSTSDDRVYELGQRKEQNPLGSGGPNTRLPGQATLIAKNKHNPAHEYEVVVRQASTAWDVHHRNVWQLEDKYRGNLKGQSGSRK